jgi:hypothetical protein
MTHEAPVLSDLRAGASVRGVRDAGAQCIGFLAVGGSRPMSRM